MKLFTIFYLLFSYNVHASLGQLVREFKSNNQGLVEKKLQIQMASLGLQSIEDKRPWTVMYSGSVTNNQLDSSSSFSNQNSKTLVHSISFLKDTIWGGQFKLENVYYHEDRDPSHSALSFGSSSKNSYQFYQKLSYAQQLGANFLGRKDYQEKEFFSLSQKLAQKNFDESLSMSLLSFFELYSRASLAKKQLSLQRDALLRAKKRTGLIKKMVNDGLRLKVDLYSAQMAEIAQREAVTAAENNLFEAIDQLSSQLHRKVSENEIGGLNEFDLELPVESIEELKKNSTLSKLEMAVEQAQVKIKNADYSVMPDIEFEAGYKTNRIKSENSDIFDEGKLGENKYELVVSLNAVWPLGFGPQKAELAKQNVERKILEYQKKSITASLKQTENLLRKRIEHLKNNLKQVTQRVNLARLVLRQYNKLYDVGKKDFDQVIRSEEDLIRTETALSNYLAQKQVLEASLNQIYGTLEAKLMSL
ncbi:MAG: TolC family protein [Bacteriovoracaceae bacterium]